MAKIPKFNTINDIMEKKKILQDHRNYLGYSSLGGNCTRETWYNFRWVKDIYITPRISRLFDRGNIEEARIINDLFDVGCYVSDAQKEVIGVTGHVKGHIDGEAIGVPTAVKTKHLFEAKTMKDSQYKKYIKEGLKKFSPKYWQQIHSYMGHTGLDRCLFVAVNKDTEERDYQRIHFDKSAFKDGESIAFSIITSENPPPKLPNASKIYYMCQICNYKKICHDNEPVKKSCRTCKHWDIEDDGKFSCSIYGFWFDFEDIDSQLTMTYCKGEEYELDEIYL